MIGAAGKGLLPDGPGMRLSRPTAGLRPGSPLAAFIPSFVPGGCRGAWGGFAPGRAGSITGAPAPPGRAALAGGRMDGGLAPGRGLRAGHAACPGWVAAARTRPSRMA